MRTDVVKECPLAKYIGGGCTTRRAASRTELRHAEARCRNEITKGQLRIIAGATHLELKRAAFEKRDALHDPVAYDRSAVKRQMDGLRERA